MTQNCRSKYRGFHRLTPERMAKLIAALSVGAPKGIACESAGIVKSTFYRWLRAGKALYLGDESPAIPHFPPRQRAETGKEFQARLRDHKDTCAMLEELFLATLETQAEARYQLCKRMYERAMSGDFFAIKFLLERAGREYYSLSPYFRNRSDIQAEKTSKRDAKIPAETFAVLSQRFPWQASRFREGGEIDDNGRPVQSPLAEKHSRAATMGAEPNGTAVARKYNSKFRDFSSFTPEVRTMILEALAVCTPVEIASERAGIAKSTYYRWKRAGKALHLGEDCPDIPYFAPRRPNESNADFEERQYEFDWLCAELEEFSLATMQTRARALLQLHKRMDARAMNDDTWALMFLLERICPEEFSLSSDFRNKLDEKIETTRKDEAKLLAGVFAVLNRPFPRQAPVPPGPRNHGCANERNDPAADLNGHDHVLRNGAGKESDRDLLRQRKWET